MYNLITKKVSDGKPRYEDLENSLEALRQHAVHLKVDRISMPQIGLDWIT